MPGSKKIVPPLRSVFVVATTDSAALKTLLMRLAGDMNNTALVIVFSGGNSPSVSMLETCTSVAIRAVKHHETLTANTIYLAPQGYEVRVKNLQLVSTKTNASKKTHYPADILLQSLVTEKHIQCTGIILSGSGTDGAIGMKAIKAAGGTTIVQQPATAKQKSMPLATIQNCLVDFILSPEEIAAQIKRTSETGLAADPVEKDNSIRGTVSNITGRKEIELQLKRLSMVASKTNNAVIITDAFGKTEWVNDSFVKMTGYALAEMIGKTPGVVLQGEGTEKAVKQRMSSRLRKRLPVSAVIKNYRKDGSAFWINMDITPVFENKKLISFIGVGTDITAIVEAHETRKSKAALEQQQVLFNAIAQNFPDGIIGVLDKQLNYVFAGGTEIQKLGLSPGHLIGEHVFDSISIKTNKAIEPLLSKVFTGENVNFEQAVNGNIYSINAVPLYSGNKRVNQILIVILNITKRKKAEEEMWNALNHQTQLMEMKSRFVSIASHEFRTPLSGILSSGYLILQYSALHDHENIQKHVDRITASVSSLTDILNDFLSLGKIDEGKIVNNASDFDVTEFCCSLAEYLQPNLKKNQSIIFRHKGKNKLVSLDKDHLKHVLSNLISNACKYSAEGKKIWLDTSVNKHQIKFTIKDEGIGIPPKDQPHLFETFFRADNAANIQGTGMGLHIVKRFLEVMDGTIHFESILNQGTTFTLLFPIQKSPNI